MSYEDYCALDNARRCYELALETIRLQGIREGKYEPRPNSAVELAAARERLTPCTTSPGSQPPMTQEQKPLP